MKFFRYIILLMMALAIQDCKSDDPITELPDFDNTNFDDRTYIVHVPANYNPDIPAPLMFAIHGIGVDASFTQKYSGFDKLADENGYFVVYPNSYDGFWGDGCNCQYVEQVGIDDVKYIDYLIDKMKNEYSIDTNRIYAWGWSQGGMFVNQLACRRSEVFAAFASCIGTMRLPVASACFPKRPVNIVLFNGTADQDVNWEGLPNTEFAFMAIPELFEKWAGISDCNNEITYETLPDSVDQIEVQKISYTNCDQKSEVVLYKIVNGIHYFYRNKEIDISAETFTFFNKHILN